MFYEVCVTQATYFLAMTNSPQLTYDDKYTVDWLYIFIIILCILINFYKIMLKIGYEAIPEIYMKHKDKKKKDQYKAKLDKWIETKL